jgi:riboflavin kinase/FMN adenylyltransferase
MFVQRGFERPAEYRGGVLSIGNFDGVHRGHQTMLRELGAEARRLGGPAVAMTFDPHPISLLNPARVPPALCTLEEKCDRIAACGVDVLIVYSTSRELLALDAREFFERIVCDELQARGLVEGESFCFGRNRGGDVSLLKELCTARQMSLQVVCPVLHDGSVVSSSAIRDAIRAGRLATANAMLGHAYSLTGTVTRGAGRGRELGFPTANLEGVATLIPADGVYAGFANLDGRRLVAAVHIGPNPTFGDDRRKLEVHLVDYRGDLYGRALTVQLLDRIRETRSFPNREAIVQQVQTDIARAIELVATHQPATP